VQRAKNDNAQDTIDGVYRGTVGGAFIGLEIGGRADNRDELFGMDAAERTKAPILGRFFYVARGISILLEGSLLEDGSVRLREYSGFSGEEKSGSVLTGNLGYLNATGGQWKLNFKRGKASGFFCKCDVKSPGSSSRRAITLVRISKEYDPRFYFSGSTSSTCYPEPDDRIPDIAYYNLLIQSPLKAGAETAISNEVAYVRQQDQRFKVSGILLTRLPDPKKMNKINKEFMSFLNKMRIAAAQFRQGMYFEGGAWESAMNVVSIDRHRVKVIIKVSCSLESGSFRDSDESIANYDLD